MVEGRRWVIYYTCKSPHNADVTRMCVPVCSVGMKTLMEQIE